MTTLSNITPTVMLSLFIYWTFKELCKHRIHKDSKLFWLIGHPYSLADAVVTPALIILVGIFAYRTLPLVDGQLRSHEQNFLLFFISIALSQAIRAFSVRTRQFKQFLPSYLNVAHVGILNFLAGVYVYSSAFSNSSYAKTIGWLSIAANAGRILKYRAYDDFVAKNVDTKNVVFGSVYIVMIFDVVWRSLVAMVLSFALACLLLIENPNLTAAKNDLVAFVVDHPSHNLFLDLTYFAVVTLTTVGLGDITPVTSTAKLVTSVFMLVGYVLFATIIGLSVSIASDIRKR